MFTHKELMFLKQLVYQTRSLSEENYRKYSRLYHAINDAIEYSNLDFHERCQDRGIDLDIGHEEWYTS